MHASKFQIRFIVGWMLTNPFMLSFSEAVEYASTHVFSVNDILGGFDGRTVAEEPDILCGVTGVPDVISAQCPEETQPIFDKGGNELYPIDSEFGFDVADFLGAMQKKHDWDYKEGYAGNVTDGAEAVGVQISNSETEFYKVPPPLGTWCSGIGANSVKCSTEHYSVMEHILTCHETIPYQFVPDPVDQCSAQAVKELGGLEVDCAEHELDNKLFILSGGKYTTVPYNPYATYDPEVDLAPPEGYLAPNDNTDALNEIAASKDYSITLKDDGKVLYRWGNLIKRPNDIRLYAKIPLPDVWKQPDKQFVVNKAYLEVTHLVTNNPNDQLRAEDLENEGATGRKPNYYEDAQGRWWTYGTCYEGDKDLIVGDTLMKQSCGLQFTDGNEPLPRSEDIVNQFTNAYYTSVQRDPFQWSYELDSLDSNLHIFEGFPSPLSEGDLNGRTLVSGPRWRLTANKYGQDIPGLEIPTEECTPPPYEHGTLKYNTGDVYTTTINLLDWSDDEGPSPLKNSWGWIRAGSGTANEHVVLDQTILEQEEREVSTNGCPMSEDFDLAVYIKGDKKPTIIYNATLILEYEDVNSVAFDGYDVEIMNLRVDDVEQIEFVDGVAAFDVVFDVANLTPYTVATDLECEVEYTDNIGNYKVVQQCTKTPFARWNGASYDSLSVHFDIDAPPSLKLTKSEKTSFFVDSQVTVTVHGGSMDKNADNNVVQDSFAFNLRRNRNLGSSKSKRRHRLRGLEV